MTTGDRKLLLICQLCLRIRFPRAKITVEKGGFFKRKKRLRICYTNKTKKEIIMVIFRNEAIFHEHTKRA